MKEIISNSNLPLVSIVLATYNGSKYLSQQLESIINQTYKNIELIVIDDHSEDSTILIIKDFQQDYPIIKLIQNPANIGVVKSFEKAVELSQGDYIALADQDDIWFSEKIMVLMENIGDNLLIHSDAILINENGVIIANSHFNYAKKRNKTEFIDYLISNNVTGCTCLFSKKLAQLALPFPQDFYVHDHYLAIIASYYGRIKLLDRALLYYRQHSANSIGAALPKFDKFIAGSKIKADSYDALLKCEIFKNNWQIELLRDYRQAIHQRRWQSKFYFLKLLKIKHGLELICYYFILVVMPLNMTRKIYNLRIKIRKLATYICGLH